MDQIGSVDPRAETDHSHLPAPSIPKGSCGQIGHIPALPMSPYRLSLCLIILGWSERELARRTGEHRTTIRRWLAGESDIDTAVAGSRCWSQSMLPTPAHGESIFRFSMAL
jgi:hypothetical protein